MVFAADFGHYLRIQFVSQLDSSPPPCACDHVPTIPCDDIPGRTGIKRVLSWEMLISSTYGLLLVLDSVRML